MIAFIAALVAATHALASGAPTRTGDIHGLRDEATSSRCVCRYEDFAWPCNLSIGGEQAPCVLRIVIDLPPPSPSGRSAPHEPPPHEDQDE